MLFLTPLIHPLAKRIEMYSRRIYGINPISVHIERDPSIAWAGNPNWVGTAVWLPELPSGAPPENATDWHAWAKTLGGTDALVAFLRVTITCREPTSVVVNPPKVRRDILPVGNPPKGIISVSQTGGASLTPRRIEVNLDMEAAIWVNEDGRRVEALSLLLEPGDSEQFFIFIKATVGRQQWHLELPVIVDGKREVMRIDDDGRRFILHGGEGMDGHFWVDEKWEIRSFD
ncbi:hypothetical protein ACWEQ5_31430 [Streptomyces griseoincarnatus]